MADEELSADDAWHTLRRHGGWHLLRDAFVRFRYGDGFSHARALGLQLCLAVVPFLIALTGLISDLGAKKGGQILADTMIALTPGVSDPVVQDLLTDRERTEQAGELALALGLLTGIVALTAAMAQVERGANRIYGVERGRHWRSTGGPSCCPSSPAHRRSPAFSFWSAGTRSVTRSSGTTRGARWPTWRGRWAGGRSASA
jgi:uncharacterized membrane protein